MSVDHPMFDQDKVKALMANAQRMIEQRKKSLGVVASAALSSAQKRPAAEYGDSVVMNKTKRIADLKAEIAAKLSSMPGRGAVDAAGNESKPRPLILDEHGRTVDASGNQVTITPHMPTLKANIRAKRRAEFSQQLLEKPKSAASADTAGVTADSQYFDPRVASRAAAGVSRRGRRAFSFHEPGKFQQQAARVRARHQLERLQSEIANIARRTGISSAMRLAMAAPRIDGAAINSTDNVDLVPSIEWWDQVLLADSGDSYDAVAFDSPDNAERRFANITSLVEHPAQLTAPLKRREECLPLMFTKAERKKMRRTNRREAWKDKQEKIRLGLEPAPEPKVRLSNLMRVLGNEAVQDPTKIEAHVRAQMARRQKEHESANAARRLTDHERKQKRLAKLQEDTSEQVHVAIYRVKDLSNPAKKFKVETNARQLFMTGVVVLFKDVNVVVVEGGPKQQKKYKKLMLSRIKWEEDIVKTASVESTTSSSSSALTAPPEQENSCTLVWEGTTKQRSFGEMRFKSCATDIMARQSFRERGVEHYWDLVYSSAVLEHDHVD